MHGRSDSIVIGVYVYLWLACLLLLAVASGGGDNLAQGLSRQLGDAVLQPGDLYGTG